MAVGVIGLGYVGLPLAVAFAEAGHDVVAVDLDPRKVAAIKAGESYIEDIPLGTVAGCPAQDLGHLALPAAGPHRRRADLRADAADRQP